MDCNVVQLDVEYAMLGLLHEKVGDRFLSLVPVDPSVRKQEPYYEMSFSHIQNHVSKYIVFSLAGKNIPFVIFFSTFLTFPFLLLPFFLTLNVIF